MLAQMVELKVATEFSEIPGPRKESEGTFSGEAFLKNYLRPRYLRAVKEGCPLLVDLDNVAGYPTSFLEEAFGGLAREFGPSPVEATLVLSCYDEPYISDEIKRYIREAGPGR